MSDAVEVAERPECDVHKHTWQVGGIPATVDGKTIMGPWAYMCDECFTRYGVGLGTGKGQRLIVKS